MELSLRSLGSALQNDRYFHQFGAESAPPNLFHLWSSLTRTEKHMTPQTTEELKSTLLAGVYCQSRTEIIAIAGIFLPRTKTGEEITFKNKRVVELGSNIVLPQYRHQGIGRHLIEQRLEIAREKDWQVVCITTNLEVRHLLERFGAQIMDPYNEMTLLRQQLCCCPMERAECMFCPKQEKTAWFFP